MSPDIEFLHDYVILDACCAINLCVSGQMEAVLRSLPVQVAISAFVAEEEVRRCDIQPFIQAGLLHIVEVETEEEAINALTFAADLGEDGEAYTGAIAIRRGWAIVSDERRVLSYFERRAPHLQRLTTPELLKYWTDKTHPDDVIVGRALNTIATEGNYTIGQRHVCHDWWISFLDLADED